VLAEQEGDPVGALGFDADPDTGRAELWGPFTVEDRLATAEALLRALRFPPYVRTLSLFCNVHNALCAEVAARHGFTEGARTHLLHATRASLRAEDAEGVRPFKLGDAPAVAALHDALFPGTYDAGESIVQRLGKHRQLFVAEDAEGVCAYAYAEALPEHGEGSLEFVGVAPRVRGRGLGTRLVQGALAWLFSFSSVADVRLSVEAENEGAGVLYRRVGFRLRHTLRSFHKRR
jgi:ribosomal protein S18 acetylase RimI-like enzyme